MSAQHTPGPWLFDEKKGWIYQKPDPLTTYVIAILESSNEANGYVLAASVELLVAARHLLDVGEFCRTDDTESALRGLRAAIAKATSLEGE